MHPMRLVMNIWSYQNHKNHLQVEYGKLIDRVSISEKTKHLVAQYGPKVPSMKQRSAMFSTPALRKMKDSTTFALMDLQ